MKEKFGADLEYLYMVISVDDVSRCFLGETSYERIGFFATRKYLYDDAIRIHRETRDRPHTKFRDVNERSRE